VRPALFAADERFPAPHTFWLPLGMHAVVAEAPGYLERRIPVDLTRNERVPLQIALAPVPPPVVPHHRSRRPMWIAAGGAAVAAAIGVTFHLLAVDTRSDLAALPDGPEYDRTRDRFALQRGIAIGGYGGAAVAGGLAVWLGLRGRF
jgi:hypothetical protein